MKATAPQQVHELWTRAFNAQDMPAVLALYEPEAVLVPSPDERVKGHDAIQAMLGGFVALQASFEMSNVRVVEAGDLAMLFSEWQLDGTGPDGSAVHMTGVTADLVRRQGDGSWLVLIDSPFGGGQAAA